MERTGKVAVGFAVGRAVFGVALAALPGTVGSSWFGADAKRRPAQVPVRGLGVRDVAVSAGIALAAKQGGALRPWLAGCVAADLADVAAILAAGDSVPSQARNGTLAIAGGSALMGTALVLAAER